MTNSMSQSKVDRLTAELSSPEAFDRFDTATIIGTHQVAEAADALVARLGTESDCQVRERVTWATVRVIDAALPGVLKQLTDGDDLARKQAAHVLSKAGRPEFADLLGDVVNDPNPDVAVKGYRAAAQTGNPVVLPLLAGRLGHGDALQKDQLTNALLAFGPEAVDVLVEGLDHADADVRAHAAESLGYFGADADAALDALVAATRDEEFSVRTVAVSSLGQLGEVADEALAGVAAGEEPLLAAAATSLQQRRAAQRQND